MLGRWAAFVLMIGAFVSAAHAQNSAYLDQLPARADIEAAFPLGGDDPVDAAARQIAAFSIVSDTILKTARDRGSDFTATEQAAYNAARFEALFRVREGLGYPRVACGDNEECWRFDNLLLDYQWRDEKKAAAFRQEFAAKLYPSGGAPSAMRLDPSASPATVSAGFRPMQWLGILGGLAAGLFLTWPGGAIIRGQVTALGSGIVRDQGLETFNRRHRIKIGTKKLGTSVTSARIDDALLSALNSGSNAAVGAGWVMWFRWILSVSADGDTEREGFISFAGRTIPLVPLLALIAGAVSGIALYYMAGPAGAFAGVFFFLGAGIGQVLSNIRAWLGASPIAPPKSARAQA